MSAGNEAAEDQRLYDEQMLFRAIEKVEVIDFHQTLEVAGVKFTAYNAGHVLGAAMFQIEIAGVRLFYTGDYSRDEDRHLMSAEVPSVPPDVMVMASTFGIAVHESREQREAAFTR